MTATVSSPGSAQTANGRVLRITGPVVDVEFPRDAMPQLFTALHAEVEFAELAKTLTLEVAQHLGDNVIRAVSMQPTDGLVRGVEVTTANVHDAAELDAVLPPEPGDVYAGGAPAVPSGLIRYRSTRVDTDAGRIELVAAAETLFWAVH